MDTVTNAFPDARILVIDDNRENVKLIARFLEFAGYLNVEVMTDSASALKSLERSSRDIILLDWGMPKPDGLEILTAIRRKNSPCQSVPVLVFTGDTSSETRVKALNAGAADFLTKPGDAQEILLRVKNFLQLRQTHVALEKANAELANRVQAQTTELTLVRREALEALARVAEFREDATGLHAQRVGETSTLIAERMGQPEAFLLDLRLAAPLHDVGKIAVPDAILKKEVPLDQEETMAMWHHTAAAEKIFARMESPLMKIARDIALNHHERWDGSGYPRGLKGDAIPLVARIVAVADAYDSLVHVPLGNHALSRLQALADIRQQSGGQFDPDVVTAFAEVAKKQALDSAT